ncbi:ribonucleotide-diphosphate reductase subunit beta [Peribacillus huizhouensis]|uniref:ribonucleotide-diphosphate reductase subunit beta n=1 Tax=Peribacillus huizhouensis TaxID=1501239 RepID=UPI0015FD26C6|nr:ribonucleotide-diphosphate reductase subunit beta [Peribacillus huizhouensis]
MNPNKATALFGGEASGFLLWNDIQFPHWAESYNNLRESFWKADDVSMVSDRKQYPELAEKTRDAYERMMGALASMDGPQTRLALILALYATDPAAAAILAYIAQQEAEHNTSYTYTLSSIMDLAKQKAVFERGRVDPILRKRNESLTDIYNEFVVNPSHENIAKVLVHSSILEGLYFYSAFAFFYNLARQSKMVGTSTMISYINRDEMQHGRFIAELFRGHIGQHPELNTSEFTQYVYDTFREAVDNEIVWSKEVLSGVDGIDLVELADYIRYRANKVLRLLGLSDLYEGLSENPMPWIRAYVDNFNGTKTDQFEQRPRTYSKVSASNGMDDL